MLLKLFLSQLPHNTLQLWILQQFPSWTSDTKAMDNNLRKFHLRFFLLKMQYMQH